MKRDGHIMATDLMLWCASNEPAAPAPGKDDFHMETVCTLVNIIGNAARSSVKVCTWAATDSLGSHSVTVCDLACSTHSPWVCCCVAGTICTQ